MKKLLLIGAFSLFLTACNSMNQWPFGPNYPNNSKADSSIYQKPTETSEIVQNSNKAKSSSKAKFSSTKKGTHKSSLKSTKRTKHRSRSGSSCDCGYGYCYGPRGGRYCITSGGNKRYQ